MNIGQAVQALKEQKRVQRAGWNGKGMWLIMLNPGWDDHPSDASEDCTLNNNTHIADGEERNVEQCIALKTAANTLQPGWNASTPDLLAEDWQIVA